MKRIGILTGGGDVPGLNAAIKSFVYRLDDDVHEIVGLRRGWAALLNIIPDSGADNSAWIMPLNRLNTRTIDRSGGTVLHTSRVNPSITKPEAIPPHLAGERKSPDARGRFDLTAQALRVINFLKLDALVALGGDGTLTFARRLHAEGVPIMAIPKTMDNDVYGTDYCIGFSTCITRTIQLTNSLRTSAGSHERFMVLEVFGRYAGFTAMLPTMAGAANRCVIPEHKFNIERLTELLSADRKRNPSHYSTVLVSEGAMFEGGEMIFEKEAADAFGHKKLGGIGDLVSEELTHISPKYNNGKKIEVINQKLGYLVRCGDPDAIDSIVPMAYGNLALDLILGKIHGRLVVLKNGRYDNMPIDTVTSTKKVVNIKEHYSTERLRPHYASFEMRPLFIMTSEMG